VSKIAATTETRVITSQQRPLRLREVKHWPTLAEFLAGQEKQYIDQVVNACNGDKPAAAKVLGIDSSKLG
jgi:DNA-binding NtrC family response regulator